jgi:hypothetical protein
MPAEYQALVAYAKSREDTVSGTVRAILSAALRQPDSNHHRPAAE